MEDLVKHEGVHSYVEKGEGPVLLVLHGLFGALSNFNHVFDQFSDRYRVVIPLMPLYTLPLLKTSVKNLAKYIHEFVEFKGYDKVNLLGNSLGGHVSLVYSVEHPDRVNTMTLTGSSGLYENAFGGSFPRREDRDYIRTKVEYTFHDPKHCTPELLDEVIGIIADKEKLIRILAMAKSAIRHNMSKDLPGINIPVCLIWGKQDNVTPPHVADVFNETLPDSDLFWVNECGHAPMMEQPEEFNKILDPWLSEHVKR